MAGAALGNVCGLYARSATSLFDLASETGDIAKLPCCRSHLQFCSASRKHNQYGFSAGSYPIDLERIYICYWPCLRPEQGVLERRAGRHFWAVRAKVGMIFTASKIIQLIQWLEYDYPAHR
jgi:hypothetical protein